MGTLCMGLSIWGTLCVTAEQLVEGVLDAKDGKADGERVDFEGKHKLENK